ncbi:MAG: hypothetical protein WC279_12795 [Sulfurimonas sp.]|uniref:hypothetical protein n=1 Tax=Sulfurimonas sp. TaxID=2022749 RepID=UPI0035677B14
MNFQDYALLAGLFFTFLTSLIVISSRFVRLESEVKTMKEDIEEFNTLRDMIYRIHAQNDLLLHMKTKNQSQP